MAGGQTPDAVIELAREILTVVPGGCTWLLPVPAEDGRVVDFRIAATSGGGHDLYGRGLERVDARLSELYPGMVGGPLWQMYQDVLSSGSPGHLPDYPYEEKRSGMGRPREGRSGQEQRHRHVQDPFTGPI